MYNAKFLSKAERQLKKLTKKNKPLAKKFKKSIESLRKNPYREAKVGDLKGVWGYGFRFNRTDYRIAYIIIEEEICIFIIGVGTRADFWNHLKKYWNNKVKNDT